MALAFLHVLFHDHLYPICQTISCQVGGEAQYHQPQQCIETGARELKCLGAMPEPRASLECQTAPNAAICYGMLLTAKRYLLGFRMTGASVGLLVAQYAATTGLLAYGMECVAVAGGWETSLQKPCSIVFLIICAGALTLVSSFIHAQQLHCL